MIDNTDIAFMILGGIGLWLLTEIWIVLKDIREELNPRKYKKIQGKGIKQL